MSTKWGQHRLMIAAMIFAAATGAMGFAAIPSGEPKLSYQLTAEINGDELVANSGIEQVLYRENLAGQSVAGQAVAHVDMIDKDLECLAKVVVHEAANQSRAGQLAVAQLVMNRVGRPSFGHSVCEVVHQRGQFFDTTAFHPRRDTKRWALAVEVSREAMAGHGEQVVPGSLFYHAAYQPPNRFFRTRERITMLGDHIFYR